MTGKLERRYTVKVAIHYEDGYRWMKLAQPGDTHTQEISTNTWCQYRQFMAKAEGWHNFLKKLDNFAFAVETEEDLGELGN
jgi:hypothetical protein